MGVEYRHFLVVNDPGWRPEAGTAARVEAVLREWGLADRPERALDLARGEVKEVAVEASRSDPGPGLALEYPATDGIAAGRIAAPWLHGHDEADGCTKRTWLVVGSDYRVQKGCEVYCFDLVAPPTIAGEPIEPHKEHEDGPPDLLFEESFPSGEATTPPVVRIHIEENGQGHVGWTDFQGFWRGAVVIDFGKSLPGFIDGTHRLPARDFVAALSEAFRGPLAEIGEVY